jgi:lysyl-tRNA synthetase class 2
LFHIGPLFRNESSALIEFVMIEAIAISADQEQALRWVEGLTRQLARGFPVRLADAAAREALMSRWAIVDFYDAVSDYVGFDARIPSAKVTRQLAVQLGIDISISENNARPVMDKIGYALLKGNIGESFSNPTFVNHFPKDLSPLARSNSNNPAVADRGYMFFRGHRMCEVVQEESDAQAQLTAFLAQDEQAKRNPDNSHVNHALVEALALGCPPMAGFGFHINRFMGAITGLDRVSDLVPFPMTSSRIAR